MFEIKELVLNFAGNGSDNENAREWIPYQLPSSLLEFVDIKLTFRGSQMLSDFSFK